MAEFTLRDDYIELDKLLKATRLCGTGGEAKIMITEGLVSVDGLVETRRRCKIRPGMTVEYNGSKVLVSAKTE